MVKTSYH